MNNKNEIWAFLLGGIVGAAVGLLYAPKAGDELRHDLVENGRVVKDKAIDSFYKAQTRVETLTEESKKRLGELQKIGRHTLDEQKESLKTGLEQAKQVLAGEIDHSIDPSYDEGLH